MSEELLQRDLKNPPKFGRWDFYNIGATTVKALKEYGIIRNVNYGNEEKKKVDALLVQKKNVIAVIEYKKTSEFKTAEQKNKAIKQELEVARKLNAHIFIATDTKETVWINVATGNRIKDENNKELKVNFDIKDEKLPELFEKIIASINEQNDQIKPKELVNPTDLARSIWQDIWVVSGESPTNSLYTFVELFIFKYLSDLDVLKGTFSFYQLFDSFKNNSNEEVLEIYAKVIRPQIKKLFPRSSIDKTTVINGSVFINSEGTADNRFSLLFKKVLTKFYDYGKLEYIDYDFKSQLFESFLRGSISKKNLGQFFTPLNVVRAIVEMAKDDIKDGIKICDPACGVGKFLLEAVKKHNNFYDIKRGKLYPKIEIIGFDKGFEGKGEEQKTIIMAKANMLIYFSDLLKENPTITTEFANLFNSSFKLRTNSILGTLAEPVENEYDLILTNPPYVTTGVSGLKEEIKNNGHLVTHYKLYGAGVEGLFMEWIIRALKPNGKAFIVVPDGIFNRQNDKSLRQFIIDECFIDGIVSLPLNTFFTTNKKTYILCLTKKIDKKEIQSTPIFTYLVSEIGESRDVYRFNIEQDDLSEAVTLYSFFKGNKTSFEKINTDKRCKIFPFSKFQTSIEQSWIIDKWWSEEEKIELGIVEKDKSIKFEELPNLIEEVANNILSFKEEILQLNEKKKHKPTVKEFGVKDLFKIERGSGKYIKRYVAVNKGDFPVYSGNTFGAFAHINTFDYEKPCISWVIDGLAGYIMVHSNEKFSATNHRGVLIPLNGKINLEYAKFVLEPLFRQSKKGRIGGDGKSNEYTALPPFMVENIKFSLPIDEDGNIDIDKQNEFVEKILSIKELNVKIENYKKQIEELNVEIENTTSLSVNKPIKEIFDLDIKTNNSQFTKTFIDKHKGNIPVHSASKFPENVDYGYVQDNLPNIKYFEDCLTWNIDGSVGKVHYRKGRFSLSEKVIPLIFKNLSENNLDIDFLKYTIESEFAKYAFGFDNKAGKGKIQNIEIPIPINSKGDFDLSIQKEIAKKYHKIEQIKKSILEELDKIASIEIDYA